jgi:hypothetical protein
MEEHGEAEDGAGQFKYGAAPQSARATMKIEMQVNKGSKLAHSRRL